MLKNILIILGFFIAVLCYITPEKTNSGEYTDLVSYWTDEEYFNNNF